MKLNESVIFDYLDKSFEATMHGEPSDSLHLPRPVFCMPGDEEFLADHLYVASADHLPVHPIIRKGAVLVVVGDSMQLSFYTAKCVLIQISGKSDFFSVYLAIQRLFDSFDSWNDELFELFKADADIQKVIECSTRVFENPIVVIDNDFNFIASAGHHDNVFDDLWSDPSGALSGYSIEHFLSSNELHFDEHEPLFLRIVDRNALCVNLFTSEDGYVGCLCIITSEDRVRPGHDALASYLARIIEKSIARNPGLVATERNARRLLLRDLVCARPVRPDRRWLLDTNSPSGFICVSLHAAESDRSLPLGCLCTSFEASFPGSYAFSEGGSIVGVVDLSRIGCTTANYRREVDRILSSMSSSLKLSAGVSNDFDQLNDVPVYAKQAERALEIGSLSKPQDQVHYYMDNALIEMVISSLSGAPIKSFFPLGLRLVLEHDRHSSVSYLETLKVFLAENMNYSRASEILYVHRSTLVDRINKIENSCGLDLHDPDTRLYLQLLMKALEAQDHFRLALKADRGA